jgi:hypothetical protein
VTGPQKPLHHIGSHPPKSDHAQFHVFSSLEKAETIESVARKYAALPKLCRRIDDIAAR